MRSPPPPANLSQDEGTTAAVESIVSCCAVVDPSQPGQPLVHVSAGFEVLCGTLAGDLLGRSCTKVRLQACRQADMHALHACSMQHAACSMQASKQHAGRCMQSRT